MKALWLKLCSMLCLVLISCQSVGSTTPLPLGAYVHSWITTGDQAHLLAIQEIVQFRDDDSEPTDIQIIDIDDTITFQLMDGVGAAFTDSAATLINSLPPSERDMLLYELFDKFHQFLHKNFCQFLRYLLILPLFLLEKSSNLYMKLLNLQ